MRGQQASRTVVGHCVPSSPGRGVGRPCAQRARWLRVWRFCSKFHFLTASGTVGFIIKGDLFSEAVAFGQGSPELVENSAGRWCRGPRAAGPAGDLPSRELGQQSVPSQGSRGPPCGRRLRQGWGARCWVLMLLRTVIKLCCPVTPKHSLWLTAPPSAGGGPLSRRGSPF